MDEISAITRYWNEPLSDAVDRGELIAALDCVWRSLLDGTSPPDLIICNDMPGHRMSGKWRGKRFAYRSPSFFELLKRHANG